MRLSVLVQNGHFGRAALGALMAALDPDINLVLIVEGPSGAPAPGPFEKLGRQVEAWLHKRSSSRFAATPLGWAHARGASHQSVGHLEQPDWERLGRRLVQKKVDALVCLGFGQLIPPLVLAQVPLALNVHPSLLPKFRGPSPIFWWLLSGRAESGVSIHHIQERADVGLLVDQHTVVPPMRASGSELATLFGQAGGRRLARVLQRHQQGQLIGWPQRGAASWAPRPKPEHAMVTPLAWSGAPLLRFCSGAGLWQTPRIAVADRLFFARSGVSFAPNATLPGDFVQIEDKLIVQVRDGTVTLAVQR